jgi:hypothetical protein
MQTQTDLTVKSDAEILLAFEGALADYTIASKHECSGHLLPGIREWMSRLSAEMQVRGLRYSADEVAKLRSLSSPPKEQKK